MQDTRRLFLKKGAITSLGLLSGKILIKKELNAAPDKRPNILLIVSDDHGWGDLPGNWKKTNVQMPVLESIAENGIRFSEYHTAPLCGPARAGIMTGQYSMDCGMWRGPGKAALGDNNYRGIKYDVKMLPEILKNGGYRTGLFGKWHLGELPKEVPNERGFEEFYGFLKGAHPYKLIMDDKTFYHNKKKYCENAHSTDYITDKSMDFIKKVYKEKKNFFTYVAYNAVHGPLWREERKIPSAPEKWLEKAKKRGINFPRRDYVATLEHMDYSIGKILGLLKKLKVEENTFVIFVSDNGAITMQYPAKSKYPGNNGPLRDGKGSTYQGGLQVPCIMKWEDELPKGLVSNDIVAYVDIFPTVLDSVGLSIPKMNGKNPVRGMSLLPHIKSKTKKSLPERDFTFELTGKAGFRRGKWKLVGQVEESRGNYKETAKQLTGLNLELYNLEKDRSEKDDLRTKYPEQYSKLKKEMIAYFQGINTIYPGAPTSSSAKKGKQDKSQMSREERQKLRENREKKKKK